MTHSITFIQFRWKVPLEDRCEKNSMFLELERLLQGQKYPLQTKKDITTNEVNKASERASIC